MRLPCYPSFSNFRFLQLAARARLVAGMTIRHCCRVHENIDRCNMSLICLIHGSTQDARCWELLAPELKKLGHSILHPQLPTDEPEAGSSRYADVILQSLPADARKVTLVAHSASGYFLPLVAAQRRLRCLVFLAATLPQLGMSFLDQLRAGPAMFCPDWAGKDPGRDDAAALHFLFHDCSPEVARWAMTTRIRLPLQKVATEIYPLDRWPEVASSYIVCAQDRTLSPQWSRWVARERLGVKPIEISAGHCPYLSRPVELAGALSTVAQTR
jgi:pimeloyl-ACP methyl ester carboxylesterase